MFPWGGFRCSCWSGGRVREGEDGGGGPGGGACAAGAGKALAHLALRARCRFRSMTVRYFASSLASAAQLAFPARIAAVTARRAAVKEISREWNWLPGAAALDGRGRLAGSVPGQAAGHLAPAIHAACSCRMRSGFWTGASARWTALRRRARTCSRAARSPPVPPPPVRRGEHVGRVGSCSSCRSVIRQNSSGTSWPSTSTQYSTTRTRTVTPPPAYLPGRTRRAGNSPAGAA